MIKRGRFVSGQVWIETVIYTLIGLSLIGLVLAIVTPKINESRDRAVVEQTIAALNTLDKEIRNILSAPGNVRVVEFRMRRGDLHFDTVNDKIIFELNDSKSLYSEPGVDITHGRINIITTEGRKEHSVVLSIKYAQNLTYENNDLEDIKFSRSSVPYQFSVENKGFQGNTVRIDISEG